MNEKEEVPDELFAVEETRQSYSSSRTMKVAATRIEEEEEEEDGINVLMVTFTGGSSMNYQNDECNN